MAIENRYWDSSTIVALLNAERGRAPTVLNVLDAAEAGNVKIFVSALAITECLKYRGAKPILAEDQRKVAEFFQHDYISVVSVDRWIAFLAQRVVWENNVPARDAIHVATALKKKIPVLETYDGSDLIRVSGKIGVPPLIIREPVEYGGQPGLFDEERSQEY